jgi:hypothetical protein
MCIHEKNESRRPRRINLRGRDKFLRDKSLNLAQKFNLKVRISGLIFFGLTYIFAQGLVLSLFVADSPTKETAKIKHLKTIDFNSHRRYFQLLNLTVLEKEKKMFVINPAGVKYRWGVVVYDFYLREILRFGKAKFKRPVDLATDGEKIYIVDTQENCVKVFNSGGKFLFRFGKNGSGKDEFNQPQSIVINPRRKWLYVTDLGNAKVKVFDYEGNYLFDFGKLNRPQSITVDKEGKLYVVEPLSCEIKIFDPSGTRLVRKFGDDLLFARPSGIAVDSQLNIYVLDTVLNTVQVFDQRGFPLYAYGKKGSQDGEFNSPNGIYIDENDKIYIADTNNQRVQIFEIIK